MKNRHVNYLGLNHDTLDMLCFKIFEDEMIQLEEKRKLYSNVCV